MFGQNSSMNVATATAVAVFEIIKNYMLMRGQKSIYK